MKFFAVTASPLSMPEPSMGLAVDLPEDDVDGPEDHDGVGDSLAEAHVLEQREVDEGRRAHAVAVRVERAVADEKEAEFSLGALEAPIGFAGLGPEAAELGLGVHDRAGGQVAESLEKDTDRLAHF